MVFARPPGQPTSPSANVVCFKKFSFDYSIYGVFSSSTQNSKIPLFFTSFDVKGTEEQPYMGIQLCKAFGFPFLLAVADAQQDDDR